MVYNNKTASLVEASILASIAIVFAAVSLYFPVLGAFANLVWPVPLILLGVRHGLKWSILCLVIAGVIIAIVISPLQSLYLVLGLGFIGITLGWALHNGKSALKSLFFGSISSFLSKIAVLAFSFFVMGINPIDFSPEMIQEAIKEAVDIYRSMGIPEEAIEQTREQLTIIFSMVEVLVPAALLLGSVVDTLINFIVSKAILKRLGTYIPDIKPFKEWLVPNIALILYGVSILLVNFYQNTPDTMIYKIGINFNILMVIPLIVQGMAVVWYFIEKKQLPRFVKGLFVLGFFLGPVIPFLTVMVGMTDFVFDFRRIRQKPTD